MYFLFYLILQNKSIISHIVLLELNEMRNFSFLAICKNNGEQGS